MGLRGHFTLTVRDMSLHTNLEVIFYFLHQMTPFHVAAEKGRCEAIMGHLLRKGGNINIKDDDGVIVSQNTLLRVD